MKRILHVDSSPRSDRSISRSLTEGFIAAWKEMFPSDTVTYRNLGHYSVPLIDESWITASFTPPEQITSRLATVLALSDELIDELLAAEIWVFGIPMYNYSVPANFKAYIDQIVRVRRTFIVNERGEYEGLVHNKKVIVITARGGVFSPGTPNAELDFQEHFMRAIFNLIGVTDITFIHAENLAGGAEARQQSLSDARAAIQQFIAACGGSGQ
ncbi:MAG TPA: NAD(P)H-dependent oxidoreductase [Coleofasciculaceae cyanobacterium]|jgi:FMN-dependent NADH-azoreductase